MTGTKEWSCGFDFGVVTVREDENDVSIGCVSENKKKQLALPPRNEETNTALFDKMCDYFRTTTSLSTLYEDWGRADTRFIKVRPSSRAHRLHF